MIQLFVTGKLIKLANPHVSIDGSGSSIPKKWYTGSSQGGGGRQLADGMGTSTRDLEQLLARAADGDMDAFGQLYHATSAKLFGIVLRILKNRAQSEDILQEIYVRVWERAGDFEPGRASIITWMATIARNRAIDALRRDKRHEVVVDDFDIDQLADHDDLSVADDAERNDDLRQLEFCLGGLDDERRTMVRLAYLDGFSRAELAERFAQPVGTIKTWLHRSLKQLKECLGS